MPKRKKKTIIIKIRKKEEEKKRGRSLLRGQRRRSKSYPANLLKVVACHGRGAVEVVHGIGKEVAKVDHISWSDGLGRPDRPRTVGWDFP